MDIVSKRRIFLSISFVLIVISAVMLVSPSLNLGIDFTSGSTVTYQFAGGNPGTDAVSDALAKSGHPQAIVQALGDDQYFI